MTTEPEIVADLDRQIIKSKLLLDAAVKDGNWGEASMIAFNLSQLFRRLDLEARASEEGVAR